MSEDKSNLLGRKDIIYIVLQIIDRRANNVSE